MDTIKNLTDIELVKKYKLARENFLNSIDGTQEEKQTENTYSKLSEELNKRNLDLRDF